MLKNPKYSPKPQVTISLEPILEAYLRFIFKTPDDQEAITINLQKDLGKLIYSHVHSAHCFRKGPSIPKPVTVILPITEKNSYSILSGFLYVDAWGLEKIKSGVEYEYRKWIERRFEIGYRKKHKQKAIIEAVLRGLNVRNNCANFDAIKQIDFRKRQKEEELRFESLLEPEL